MSQLRDDSSVLDPRLDRLPDFDPASRAYGIRGFLTPTQLRKPRSYTWRVDRWFDQGREGQCVEYAYTHELAARPVAVKLPDETDPTFKTLMQQRYWEMQKIDPWPGGEYPGATPRYGGTSVLAGAKIHQQLGFFSEYRWAFGLEEVLLAVGYAGPIVLGLNWYEGMFRPDDKGFLHKTGQLAGGHAILCHSVSVRERVVWLWNSWGKDWGLEGRAKVSFDDLEALLHERGEACVPVGRARP